jgi:sugar/nucleoside kinase (ribokinase family)
VRIDYLALGNPTLDVQPWASPALGGSVAYSAIQAARLGLRSTIFGRADPVALQPYWRPYAKEVHLQLQPSNSITTFYNASVNDSREQWLKAWAGPIRHAGPLPDSEILHIAPVAQEVVIEALLSECRSRLVCLTPQGLLRKWSDTDGHISLVHQRFAGAIAAAVDIVVVSEIEAQYIDDFLMAVAEQGGLSVITQGSRGCEVRTRHDRTTFSAFPPNRIVDTTGAGDCLATTLAVGIYLGRPLTQAIRSAAIAASLCIGDHATKGIGTRLQIEQRLIDSTQT